MALMKHREPNMVKWVGVRPGHNGEQIYESEHQAGGGTKILYTVPVGKTLFITYFSLSSRLSADAVQYCNLSIWDTTPAFWKYMIDQRYDIAGQLGNSIGLSYPIEVLVGYSVRLYVSNAAIDGTAVLHGWIE